ncbi:protein of unknown function DUF1491 [Dinoroseobacter shibae DFL 12 = DSM 16493]|uniref:GTP-binding protein Era n=1 Tax=Dinoroseobacter shibae (strain DSM 16493 / NCIMB 14021 / DFL 12) TaxID=398580 RepID=A8LLE1_DINSH|nr:DUF1491 family protein [Dinoroseobacter shibae]ABV91951.1 protein of unknown function DUF1491 [Dinoroseobacter shibae DFL 12 = DSM 16493]URF46924.1 DUF1491 family protein [Dinoroseobacter shibae]URF51235.1 DUF1491 family protein [Dinoroseobacter shibae]
MARLAAGLWVQAYMMRCQIEGIPVYVEARGDGTAGAVIVKLCTLDGKARAYERRYDLMRDTRSWEVLVEGDEAEVDAALARARSRDPDLWIVAVEDRAGRHLLDQPGLEG